MREVRSSSSRRSSSKYWSICERPKTSIHLLLPLFILLFISFLDQLHAFQIHNYPILKTTIPNIHHSGKSNPNTHLFSKKQQQQQEQQSDPSPEEITPTSTNNSNKPNHPIKTKKSIPSRSTTLLPSNLSSFFTIQDFDLLIGDLLALTLVAQLLGFTDAILDPNFIPNGGFSAPVSIPLIPSTLSTLVSRLSVMDVSWILAGLKSRGYTLEAVLDPVSAIKCGVTMWLDHCSIRIVIALVIAVLSHDKVDGLELVRQVWFTLPIMVGWRVIYCQSRMGRL